MARLEYSDYINKTKELVEKQVALEDIKSILSRHKIDDEKWMQEFETLISSKCEDIKNELTSVAREYLRTNEEIDE